MDKYLFLDLDGTIFQTVRKCRSDGELYPAVWGRDGTPRSFMTKGQKELFSFLDAGMVIIPTTARDLDALARVMLEFRHCVILNFGGVVLTPERVPDAQWLQRMRGESLQAVARLRSAFHEIQEFIGREGLSISARIVGDLGMDLYIVAKSPDRRFDHLDTLHGFFLSRYAGDEDIVHYNDNNLCLVPRYLNKRHAVEFVISKYIETAGRPFLTLGMGDSGSDVDFMTACDYMIIPSHSQIRKTRLP